MTTSKKCILALGVLGMADTVFMLVIAAGINLGTLLPGVAGFALAAWAWTDRHAGLDFSFLRQRGIKAFVFILCCAGMLSFVIVQAFILGSAFDANPPETDWCILLGAGLRGEMPSLTLKRRLDTAVSYLTRHPDIRIVLTGGRGVGETITEAEGMRRYLGEKGIPPSRILMEDKATSTLENLRYSMQVIAGAGGGPGDTVSVISSDFHLFRVRMLASRLGLKVHLVPASTPWYLLPNNCLREYFAVVKSMLLDR